MTSKERVLKTLAHVEPDRVPLWYGASEGLTRQLMSRCGCGSEEALMERLHIDFRRVRERYVGPELGSKTIWGIERGGAYYGQPLNHPLAGVETVAQVEAHPGWPSPDWFDFTGIREQCQKWSDYCLIGGPWAVVFTDATELVGMEEYFIKMRTHPEVIHAVNQRVSDFYRAVATRFFETVGDLLDLFFFGDDFGTQQSLLISPKLWREFCAPHVGRFAELGHQAGLKTMFHSCGAVRSIVGDFCALGIDALNPVQTAAKGMVLSELKQEYGDRITFHGCVDAQHVLMHGTVEQVRGEVHSVIDTMAPGGGFCLAASHDYLMDETPPENVIAMFDEAYACGRYR